MRYTTLIDLTELSTVYRNKNCRLVYLHLALKAGYRETDLDIVGVSLRRLAADIGCTVAAVRCALVQLEKAGLIAKIEGGTICQLYRVTKYVVPEQAAKRAKSRQDELQRRIALERQQQQQQQEDERQQQQQQREADARHGKTQFMVYYENLLKKARAGDRDAAVLVDRHRAVYEQHKAAMEEEQARQKGGGDNGTD